MTKAEEAIKCIEDVLNSDYHYDESLGYQLTSDDFEWLDMAKKAFEKQMPKKPEKRGYFYCVECGKLVTPIMDFCRSCGQKIDWSNLK